MLRVYITDALQSYLWVSCQLQKRRDENAGDESATKNLLRMVSLQFFGYHCICSNYKTV